jgi:hypothetical protein
MTTSRISTRGERTSERRRKSRGASRWGDTGSLERRCCDDSAWFDAHPARRFRARTSRDGRGWIIRRRGDVLLRVMATLPLPADADRELAPTWFDAAYPGLLAARARKRARRALRPAKRRAP